MQWATVRHYRLPCVEERGVQGGGGQQEGCYGMVMESVIGTFLGTRMFSWITSYENTIDLMCKT